MADQPRIGLDYTAAIHQRAGIGRYARSLTEALIAARPDIPFRLFVADGHRSALPPPPGACRYHPSPLSERNHARLWYRLGLPVPIELWTGRLDLFHALDFSLPPTLPGTRTVLTVHDLAYEHYPAETMPGMLAFLKAVVPRSARRANHVIVPSQATRADLIALYQVSPDKISVIPHGVDARFGPQALPGEEEAIRRTYGLPEGPLVLTVGTLQPRKNHQRLVQAFEQIKERATLVIAGGKGWGEEGIVDAAARLKGRVIVTGFVAESDLPALYRTATVFVYPALYEGFGLPILEAMACGVPVLASRASALPEVVGQAGLLIDPLDVEELAAELDRLLDDPDLRAKLRTKGLSRAADFSWMRAAQQTWEIYARLLAL